MFYCSIVVTRKVAYKKDVGSDALDNVYGKGVSSFMSYGSSRRSYISLKDLNLQYKVYYWVL